MTLAHSEVLTRKLEQLAPLGEPEKAALRTAVSRVVEYDADVDIVSEGDRPSQCNVLLSGVVCRYGLFPRGRRQIYSFQFPGDIFDAHSFILRVMDHGVATLTHCRVGIIPHSTMRDITDRLPKLARAIWRDTLVDASIFRAATANIGRRPAYRRIAHLICESYVRLGAVGLVEEGEFDWPITQVEIADATGLTFVHINRTLKRLRADKLIRVTKGRMAVLDWERLRDAADFDPQYLHLPAP